MGVFSYDSLESFPARVDLHSNGKLSIRPDGPLAVWVDESTTRRRRRVLLSQSGVMPTSHDEMFVFPLAMSTLDFEAVSRGVQHDQRAGQDSKVQACYR